MNDRFKFRVWDETRKKYWGKEEWDEKTNRYYDANYIYLGIDGKLLEYHFGDVCIFDKPGQIIEQCTGLFDKNGNLIYEGDIVLGSRGSKYCIIWSEMELGWALQNLKTRLCITMNAFMPDELEIIGNIHEQKDVK